MSLEGNNSSHAITWRAFNPLFVTLHFSQRLSDIMYGNMRDFYAALLHQAQENDPFKATKRKCPPETIDHLSMEERLEIRIQTTYFSSIPLTIEKRNGPSFANKTMNNLIIDDDNKLIQLLFGWSPTSVVPPGQRLMQVREYRKGWKTVARKFERYI